MTNRVHRAAARRHSVRRTAACRRAATTGSADVTDARPVAVAVAVDGVPDVPICGQLPTGCPSDRRVYIRRNVDMDHARATRTAEQPD
jgi:hypothetical protein